MAGNGIIRVLWYLHVEGGDHMEYITMFVVSVAAGVVVHIICKWLDSE